MAHDELNGRSVAELLGLLSQQTQTLVRDEIRLAMLELQRKGKRAGIGAGLVGGSGVVALYGVAALAAAGILGLATVVDGWLAALIVAGALFALAAVLALTGKSEIRQAVPPVPEEAIESAKQDVEAVKEHVAHRHEHQAVR
jgi:membrane protein